MTPHYSDDRVTILHGDALDELRALPDASVDSVVTDPPYGLEFMGKSWDRFDEDSRARAGMTGTGYTDGAERLERPSFLGGLNPKCRNCQRWQRGGNPCSCDAPDFPNERRARSAAFGDWCLEWTAECFRVLKPGGHLLAFGGTRTWHRLACAVEDAGFEVRDSIAWLYGSGFPKSLDVSKAIDRRREEDRAPVDAVRAWLNARRIDAGLTHDAVNKHFGHASNGGGSSSAWMTNPTSRALPTWEQWQSLKALFGFGDDMDAEVWRLNGRKGKPGDAWQNAEVVGIREGAMAGWSMDGSTKFVTREDKAPATPDAERWQGWGTALKPAFEPVVVARKPLAGTVAANVLQHGTGALNIDACRVGDGEDRTNGGATGKRVDAEAGYMGGWADAADGRQRPTGGRWPTNVVLDDSQAAELDEMSGERTSGSRKEGTYRGLGYMGSDDSAYPAIEGDTGGASRFFPTFRYEAKAPSSERPRVNGTAHPTVKPLDLMRWLVRLVTPPGGTVLEPFAGSGTTVEACIVEGFRCIAIEREADYLPLVMARVNRRRDPVAYIKAAGEELGLFDLDGDAS